MAKSKKRTTGYDRDVTDSGTAATWKVGEMEFEYRNMMGINLSVTIQGKKYPMVYARDLKEAGWFAEGFSAGWNASLKMQAAGIELKMA